VKRLLQQIDMNGYEGGKPVRGHTTWTEKDVELVEELAFNQ